MLITLVFGMVDAGWAINRYSVLNNAVREGVRTASLGGTAAETQGVVNGSLDSSMIKGTPSFTMTCKAVGASAFGACPSEPESGSTAKITVNVTQDWLTPVMGTFQPGGLKLSKSMQMRIE